MGQHQSSLSQQVPLCPYLNKNIPSGPPVSVSVGSPSPAESPPPASFQRPRLHHSLSSTFETQSNVNQEHVVHRPTHRTLIDTLFSFYEPPAESRPLFSAAKSNLSREQAGKNKRPISSDRHLNHCRLESGEECLLPGGGAFRNKQPLSSE